MRRTLAAVEQLVRGVRGRYIRLFAIATSALRRADNGRRIPDAGRRHPRRRGASTLGEEEARASYRGAITAFGRLRGERVGVVDPGGGSTEYAVGTAIAPERVLSCEIGAVRLTEALPSLAGSDGAVEPATSTARARLARQSLAAVDAVRAHRALALVGGSATTTAAIVRGVPAATTAIRWSAPIWSVVLTQLSAMPLRRAQGHCGMRRNAPTSCRPGSSCSIRLWTSSDRWGRCERRRPAARHPARTSAMRAAGGRISRGPRAQAPRRREDFANG